jgi:hypothetical protein
LRRRFLGNSGSISLHKSSSISGFGIVFPRGPVRCHTLPMSLQKYKPHFVRHS